MHHDPQAAKNDYIMNSKQFLMKAFHFGLPDKP